MIFEIIKGSPKSSKTLECINRIERIKEENPEARVLFIVPEQLSYSAEKLMTGHFDGTGLNNIEVMTMSRVAERYLNHKGKNYLTAVGKAVLIQKAINNIDSVDNIYKGAFDKPGFLNNVSDTITELKKCLITPKMLVGLADKTENEMLKSKLLSIAEIYSEYQELNDSSFFDADEYLNELSLLILKEEIFKDCYIFIDEYSEFFPQFYRVIDSFMSTAKALYITLPFDSVNKEMYKISETTLYKLRRLAEKNGIKVCETDILSDSEFFESSELDFYYENYCSFNYKKFIPFENKTEDIMVYSARDPYSEVENAAKQIRWLVDKEGYRFKDITVCLGGAEDYNDIVQAVFNQYRINYFADDKLPIVEHPVILTVLSLFDILKENWSYDAVFKYLKTGFIYHKVGDSVKAISNDNIDLLDCYVLKYGIKGKKKWLDEDDWNSNNATISDALSEREKNNDEESALINEVRREIVKPIKRFIEKTSGKNTVIGIATALFQFMEDINLYEGLLSERSLLINRNMINEAQQLSQIWNLLIEVLDQITTALGDTKCSRDDFRNYLYAGLSVNEISIIPPTLDGVSVSAANAPRSSLVKALFIIGAVKGHIPIEKSEGGMLSDGDRKEIDTILDDFSIELGGGIEYLRTSEEYKLFRVIFSSTKQIYISYPLNNFNGEAQMPSEVITNLRKIFPNLLQRSELMSYDSEFERFFTVNSAFDYLLKNRNNKNDRLVADIYKKFLENEELKEKLEVIRDADSYKVEKSKINPKNAELLYEDMLNYSASRLKVFADCPFKYFLQYGLGAKPEEIWQIQKFDLGTVMHYIVCKYCEEITAGAESFEALRQKWMELGEAESDAIIDKLIDEVTKSIISKVLKDEDKIKYLLLRVKKIIKRSVQVVKISLINGEYAAVEFEKEFSLKLDGGRNVGIRGTIDRIDVSKSDTEASIRVIDYKSGSKDFSVVSVCNMQDIQLVLYAVAATQMYSMGNIKYADPTLKSKVTGMMYSKLKDIVVEAEGNDLPDIEKKLSDEMRLNGAIILDCNDDGKLDIENAVMMDKNISEKSESSFLKFSLTKKGEIYKNSECMQRPEFDKLTEYVKREIIKADREIMSGNTQILPACDKDTSACDYCEMAEVCLFDKNLDSVRKLCDNADTAWEIINNELKK